MIFTDTMSLSAPSRTVNDVEESISFFNTSASKMASTDSNFRYNEHLNNEHCLVVLVDLLDLGLIQLHSSLFIGLRFIRISRLKFPTHFEIFLTHHPK